MDVHAGGKGRSRMPIVALFAALAALLVTTLVADVRDPRDRYESERAAIVAEVDEVRVAENARAAAGGGYEGCGEGAGAGGSVSAGAGAGCWRALGFAHAPAHRVWVVVAVDDFAVHGRADLDGDGVSEEIVATKGASASLWTPPTVF